jgi:hypothetical protein
MQVSDTELLRWIVRSFDRLEEMIPLDQHEKEATNQKVAFLKWHRQIIEEAQRRELLPTVPITAATELGKQHGAF